MGRQGPKKNDNSTGVKVRIPIPSDINFDLKINGDFKQEFGFIDKIVYVPESKCDPIWEKHTPYCNNFYTVYCRNMLKDYKQQNDGKFDSDEWLQYKNECACYGELPNESFRNIPPKCFQPGCQISSTSIYLDPRSKKEDCNLTICQAIFDAKGVTSGGAANIDSKVEQNCGQYEDLIKKPEDTDIAFKPFSFDDAMTAKLNPTPDSIDKTTEVDEMNMTYVFGSIIGFVIFIMIFCMLYFLFK
jgi:hypothetical protein